MNRRELFSTVLAAGLPCELPVPDSRFQAPDLGNLYDVIAGIGCGQEPSLSFLDPKWKSLDEWKKVARPLIRNLMQYEPAAEPVSAKTLKVEERDGFQVEAVIIKGPPAYDIPAWVLTPGGRPGRLPGIIAIHCHSGRYVWGHEKIVSHPDESEAVAAFRERAYGRPYAEVLAKRGFVVVVIDGFYFGSRRLRPEAMDAATAVPALRQRVAAIKDSQPGSEEWLRSIDAVCSEAENLTAKTIFSTGATWPGLLAWDDRRSLDYLCSRPDVDPQRIGCVGLSIGGLRTGHLIATDPRVRVACVTGWMTEFRSQLRNHLRNHTWMIYIPGLYKALDLPDAVALHAPGALLAQQCGRDALYPMAAMKGSVEKLTRIYAKAGIPEKFRGTFHDVPHSFNPVMQEEAFAWIEKWI
jgi:dienelactone hydrolase